MQRRANWGDKAPLCFPPHAYVHRKPSLYRTDARSRLQVVGIFSPGATLSLEGFIRRFCQLTGIDPITTPIMLV